MENPSDSGIAGLPSSRLRADGRSGIRLSIEQRRARQEYLETFQGTEHRRVEACPACGGRSRLLVGRKDVYGLPVDNHLCLGCGLVFKDPILSEEATVRYYQRISTRLRGKGDSPAERRELFQLRSGHFARPRFRFVSERIPALEKGDLVLEIGTHDGGNLIPWRDAGYKTLGFDVDEGAFAPGRAAGLDLRAGLPGDIRLEEEPKLILLSHFVEHLSDPVGQLKAIGRLLGGGGHLFVEVPGLRDIGKRDLLGYFTVEHNLSFDLSSLRTLMAASGFDLIDGDETVRGLFRPCEPRASFPWAEKAGEELRALLWDCERWYREWTPRSAYHVLRGFLINDVLGRF